MRTLRQLFGSARRPKRDLGANLVEYALLITLIALVCFGSVAMLGNSLGPKFSNVGQSINAPQ